MIAKIYPDNHPDLQGKKDPTHPVRYFDIRKLKENEVLRLMDVPEPDIVKMCSEESGLSRSSLYKLAGNSIVVSCLYHIFRNIWLTEDDPMDGFDLFPEPAFRAPIPDKIRMVTLCSGYDSQAIAMQKIVDEVNASTYTHTHTELDLLRWSEYDPEKPNTPVEKQPAVVAHNVLFPEWADRNLGDMTKIDWKAEKSKLDAQGDGDIDILTYSTPCQSISQAGKREGIKKDSGTRSAVLWYTENAIVELKPKFLLQENVRALVNQVNMPDFREWQEVCRKHGYDNYWAVLNAKDYGVPQNRECVFMLSVRRDLKLPTYRFPKGFKLCKTIADVLDEDFDEKYLLKAKDVIRFLAINGKGKMDGKSGEDDGQKDNQFSSPHFAEITRVIEQGGAVINYVETDHKLSDDEISEIRSAGA